MIKRVFLIGLALAAIALAWLAQFAYTPVTPARLPVEVVVAPGSSARGVAAQLEQAGLIDGAARFALLARLLDRADKLKAGSYGIEGPITPIELLDKLTRGDVLMGRLTVVEGWSFRQMRALIDAQPRLRHDSRGMSDRELLAAIGAPETHPEGLFFPTTYYYDLDSSDLALYRRAYAEMRRKLDAAWSARAPNLPYRRSYEALIMASIIEKETGVPDERPDIAAVFINRLRLGMRLQTDPTVIYGLGAGFDGNLRKVDLQTDTPYNTYTRAGLPPTPIALPGEAALWAALNPSASRALYFVATGGGRHAFSDTLEAHNRAVNRYQRGGR